MVAFRGRQYVWIFSFYFDIVKHYDDVIMTMLASQITSLTVVYSIVYSGVNKKKHQSSASLAFVREIHRGPVNFPHKWPVTRKMFPFDDVIKNPRFVTRTPLFVAPMLMLHDGMEILYPLLALSGQRSRNPELECFLCCFPQHTVEQTAERGTVSSFAYDVHSMVGSASCPNHVVIHVPLTGYVKLRVVHAPGLSGTFSPPPTSKKTASQRSRHAPWHVRHPRAVVHTGIANPQWQGKRSRHFKHMRNPQFYVSGKRPMLSCITGNGDNMNFCHRILIKK